MVIFRILSEFTRFAGNIFIFDTSLWSSQKLLITTALSLAEAVSILMSSAMTLPLLLLSPLLVSGAVLVSDADGKEHDNKKVGFY